MPHSRHRPSSSVDRARAPAGDARTLRTPAQALAEPIALERRLAKQRRIAFVCDRVTLLASQSDLPGPVRSVIDTVAANLDTRFTLNELAAAAGRSTWHLNVLFRRWTTFTIHEYATCLRMSHAAKEIARGVKIEAVARSVGYLSARSFYRQFSDWFGTTPTALRPPGPPLPPRPHRQSHR